MEPSKLTNVGFQGFTSSPVAYLQQFVGHIQVHRYRLTCQSPHSMHTHTHSFLAVCEGSEPLIEGPRTPSVHPRSPINHASQHG